VPEANTRGQRTQHGFGPSLSLDSASSATLLLPWCLPCLFNSNSSPFPHPLSSPAHLNATCLSTHHIQKSRLRDRLIARLEGPSLLVDSVLFHPIFANHPRLLLNFHHTTLQHTSRHASLIPLWTQHTSLRQHGRSTA
jgi:hypothetical protein